MKMPQIVAKYRDLVRKARPLNKEIEGLKDQVRTFLVSESYDDIYVTKPKPTREIDPVQAHELIQEYYKKGLLTQQEMDDCYLKIIHVDQVWIMIRAGKLKKEHLWHPEGRPPIEKNGILQRRVVVTKKATPSIMVKE